MISSKNHSKDLVTLKISSNRMKTLNLLFSKGVSNAISSSSSRSEVSVSSTISIGFLVCASFDADVSSTPDKQKPFRIV